MLFGVATSQVGRLSSQSPYLALAHSRSAEIRTPRYCASTVGVTACTPIGKMLV